MTNPKGEEGPGEEVVKVHAENSPKVTARIEPLNQSTPAPSSPSPIGWERAGVRVAPRLEGEVSVSVTEIVIPTYMPAPPDKNPMFLENRVYQGSNGKVYPLPFTDRIAEKPVNRTWKAVWIENEFLRALVLPELGGRIHVLQDKTNGYDLIYNQPVIKPALVGLAGPWISGGIEFNWPQHHRPATFLPVDFKIEEHADGSKTVWCGDHDPMCRMKGMHGVCLHPGRAYLELKARAYNCTPLVQTFLWWANVATRVHEGYQSFFPPDVYYVADHARRSMSEYPLAKGFYYGVNYGERGRKGIPEAEIPSQFVPPHCQKSPIANRQSEIPPYVPNDLSFYANIPVPTSYMCMGSKEDFFGGYDYKAQAGIVHFANHHISPGKKQWTWGNHEFGYAWDRNLTDADERGEFRPYIEIMAGVYTDNQPDFSFLQPGETKTWSQYWYPIQKIGPVQHATLEAAVSLRLHGRQLQVGVGVTRKYSEAAVTITAKSKQAARFTRELSPANPMVETIQLPKGVQETDLLIQVTDETGRELARYQPSRRSAGKVPPPATEPPAPEDIVGADELFITGLHLEQYRHATRSPVLYWREALRRDPLDSRCNNALGLWHLRRGEFAEAEKYFRRAIERLTRRNPNPYDGEAYYNLGLCLRHLHRDDEAYDSFYKSTWNQAWAAAGYHALAEIDCSKKNWPAALEHLNQSLRSGTCNLRARNLKVLVLRELNRDENSPKKPPTMDAHRGHELDKVPDQSTSENIAKLHPLPGGLEPLGKRRKESGLSQRPARAERAGASESLGRGEGEWKPNFITCMHSPDIPVHGEEAELLLRSTLQLDPLDAWARHLNHETTDCDLQTRLDIAHDYARAGFLSDAVHLLEDATATQGDLPNQSWGALPLVFYTLGWLHQKLNDERAAAKAFREAATLPADYCFPARLEEIAILNAAMRANPADARAPYYLGNLFYDRRRHPEAIKMWERSAKLDGSFSVVWRNLGIGYFNFSKNSAKARKAYENAFQANPLDARLCYERDQLWKRLGEKPEKRLRELEKHPRLVQRRDDLSIELCALYNQTGRHEKAAQVIASRQFQPWEGGEGGPLGQHVRAQLALGRAALAKGEAAAAHSHFQQALSTPGNLGEAKHLLANQSDIRHWLGCALAALGEKNLAREQWLKAATFKGDFQQMSVRAFSEMTYYSALSLETLGRRAHARKLFRDLLAYARKLQKSPAKIDYFATSLPTMLLFDDDLQFRQETTAIFLQAQAYLGLGKKTKARSLLKTVLRRDPNHALAADLSGNTEL
jgi:tetratricopeptide (TPR) repeat protein